MKTFLICSYPRSRTLWLSYFLSIPGVCVCEHEATEHAASSAEFWQRAEDVSGQASVYGNSDSANSFVLPALLAARPLTKVVWIDRHMSDVLDSMRAAGFNVNPDQVANMIEAKRAAWPYIDLTLSFKQLRDEDCIEWLWEFLLDVPFDRARWLLFKDQKIAYRADTCPAKSTDKMEHFLVTETDWRVPARKEG
jgi:hypothetical protein